jgi:hypothetical protein
VTERTALRVSVVIPTWNAAATIERALGSVLEEHGVELECVVVDDGSTDGTADVVEVLAARDPRIALLRLPANAGVSNARNRGLESARGEWLVFHDADDRMLPGGIAALMRPTIDPSVRAVIGQRIWTDGSRTWLSHLYDIPDIREPGRKSIAANPGLLYYAAVTGKGFHRSLIGGLEFEGRVMGDQAWTIRALLRAGDGIEVIGETVFEWWRPAPDAEAIGITATSRASARGGIEMANRAMKAFAEVAAEADATLGGTAAETVKREYFQRLVRSDLADQERRAIASRDPDVGPFLDAITVLLGAVPASVLKMNEAAIGLILAPPAKRWHAISRAGRSAYWRLLDAVASVDPALIGRARLRALIAPALVVGSRRPRHRGAVSLYLFAFSLLVSVASRLMRARSRSV